MNLPEIRSRACGPVVAKNVYLGLSLFLLLLIYDGALRKWVLPGFEQILFIAKDVLLFGLLVYVLLHLKRRLNLYMPQGARALLVLYAVWVLLESANFNLPNILVGIWGLKAHLLYASIILLLPVAFNNLDDLFRKLVKIYPWAVVPVCALAFVQLTLPADSFLNQQVRGGLDMIAHFGQSGLVRVTGTFSYIAGMSSFVQAATVLGVGMFLHGARSRMFLVGFGFVLAPLPATGSRAVITVAAISVVIILIAALVSRLINQRMMIRIVLVFVILGTISIQAQDDAWTALQQRAASIAKGIDDSDRAFTAFTNAFSFFEVAGPFGFGSGSANLGAPVLSKDVIPFSWIPGGKVFEEESGRVVLELGMLGWFFSQVMRIAFLFWSVRLAMNGRTRIIRVSAVLAMPVMALGMYVGNGVFAPPIGAVYYWFCLALLGMAQYEHRQALVGRSRLREQQLKAIAT